MPYGFGGGFAAGFDSGIGHGTEIGQARLKHQQLMQEQIDEKIKVTQGEIEAGLKNLSDIVSNAPQRDPKLEQTVSAYTSQLTDAAQLLSGLGPKGEEASKFAMSAINNIVPSLQTKAEAFSAQKKGEFQGARQAAHELAGSVTGVPASVGMTPQLGAPPPVGGDTGAAPDAAPAPMQVSQSAPAPAPAPDATVTDAGGTGPAGLTEDQIFKMFLGVKGGDGTEEKMSTEMPARLGLMKTGLAELETPVSEDDETTGRELLSKPSTWKPLQALGLPTRMAGGELQRAQKSAEAAVQGALYSLTGATINPNEDERMRTYFFPSITDDDKTAEQKIRRLYAFAGHTMEMVKTRKGENMSIPESLMVAGMPHDVAYKVGEDLKAKGITGGTAVPGAGSQVEASPAASGPKAGDVEDGYRFKGGDASKPENWEKVK